MPVVLRCVHRQGAHEEGAPLRMPYLPDPVAALITGWCNKELTVRLRLFGLTGALTQSLDRFGDGGGRHDAWRHAQQVGRDSVHHRRTRRLVGKDHPVGERRQQHL